MRGTASDRVEIQLPACWSQGRSIHGGLALALLADLLAQRAGAPLRSLNAQFCAPLAPGVAHVEIEVLRRGRTVTHLAARILQSDEVAVAATGACGVARPARLDQESIAPVVPSASSLAPIPIEFTTLPFTKLLEYRLALGAPPASGSAVATTGAWIRLRDSSVSLGAPLAMVLLDAMWPSVLVRASRVSQMTTVAWSSTWLGTPEDVSPDAHLLVVAHTDAGREGYFEEVNSLYAPSGQLVARAYQTLALVR